MLRKSLWALLGFAALVMVGGGILYFNKPAQYYVLLKPWSDFDAAKSPPSPDYSLEEAWAALPERDDKADVVPASSEAVDNQASAEVDVFFLHPTTYYGKAGWNARFDEPGFPVDRLENGVLRFQASAFNGCCRVFAPRYRQATVYAFLGKGENEHAALDLAYQDVARAFENFIAERNDDRPFVLAGHSQGALHGSRLLQEKIAGTPLAERMIAAYLIGSALPADLGLSGVVPCASPTDTGCTINWNSVNDAAPRAGWTKEGTTWIGGEYRMIQDAPLACINPLNWIAGGVAEAPENLGSLPFVGSEDKFPAPRPALTGARCEEGMLIVSPPEDAEGFTYGVRSGDYHIYDYNLFYMNIRANLEERVAAYLQKRG
ncbi:conserved hypothetical protein [Parvibaculum lavamentivorans DS-1]|uniref:DUF3089 domain-containing protein n=1 Tax=Parvibaculum lavamentivorans (strain DS-1 / DSM 13023 / NCIMB 13966) TaxID=402881 RepID=A7HXP8_PARL1|nr:DUF3089 domain-containing protein [Parvibaculum lavamentivorans]ABS64681.1 conserved hypothetical protein [Parvibaculum lavamentivorans DS-1]